MELLNSSVEQLVEEIVALNRAWKIACDLFEETSPLATSLRDLKTCKQVRLLQSYGPKQVYLALDPQASGEPLFGIRLRQSLGTRQDAEHLPVRVAKEILSLEELSRLIEKN